MDEEVLIVAALIGLSFFALLAYLSLAQQPTVASAPRAEIVSLERDYSGRLIGVVYNR